MRVSEAMSREVRVANPQQQIREAAKIMAEIDAGGLPVGDNDRLVGMITDRDIAVRAVAAGLAQSGSVDGYVWEVMTETEPALTRRTRPAWRSDWMGFPPVATAASNASSDGIARLRQALLAMAADPTGRDVLALLRLDGFSKAEPSFYDSVAERVRLVRAAG